MLLLLEIRLLRFHLKALVVHLRLLGVTLLDLLLHLVIYVVLVGAFLFKLLLSADLFTHNKLNVFVFSLIVLCCGFGSLLLLCLGAPHSSGYLITYI